MGEVLHNGNRYFDSIGFFGRTIADGMDLIWKWTVGIVYFIIVVFLRVRDESLITKPRLWGEIDECEQ